MDRKKLEFFKQYLVQQKRKLLEDAAKTLDDSDWKANEIPKDFVDQASDEWDRNFLLRLRQRERSLLKKIDEALIRIEEGTYGICEECGEEISEERLLARPVTTLCINCKREQEEWEKMKTKI